MALGKSPRGLKASFKEEGLAPRSEVNGRIVVGKVYLLPYQGPSFLTDWQVAPDSARSSVYDFLDDERAALACALQRRRPPQPAHLRPSLDLAEYCHRSFLVVLRKVKADLGSRVESQEVYFAHAYIIMIFRRNVDRGKGWKGEMVREIRQDSSSLSKAR